MSLLPETVGLPGVIPSPLSIARGVISYAQGRREKGQASARAATQRVISTVCAIEQQLPIEQRSIACGGIYTVAQRQAMKQASKSRSISSSSSTGTVVPGAAPPAAKISPSGFIEQQRSEPMSMLADFGRGLAGIALGAIQQRVSQRLTPTVLPGAGVMMQPASIFPALPTIAAGVGTVLRNPSVRAAAVGAAGALAGSFVGDGMGGVRKRRRMNYGNARAARRAIRRIKGTRKLLQSIERQLPKQRSSRSRRDLAPGHTHVR